MHAAGTVRRECSSRTLGQYNPADNRGHTRDKTVAEARSVMLRAVIPSSHNFRGLKRAVPSAPTSTSPLRRGLLTKRVRPPHEVLYKLRREKPQIWLIRTETPGETRENKIVSTTTCTYVVSVVKSTQQGNQEPTPARCRPTRDDLISSTPQNTQEPRTGRVAGVA